MNSIRLAVLVLWLAVMVCGLLVTAREAIDYLWRR